MKKINYQALLLLLWAFTIIAILFCVILIVFHQWQYTLRFEMDNNTLEAIKSLNWTAIQNFTHGR